MGVREDCEGKVFSGWSSYDCNNKAKVKRNGVWYCGTHDPVRIEEKRTLRDEKWRRENALDEARYERRSLEHKILQDKSLDELREMAKQGGKGR